MYLTLCFHKLFYVYENKSMFSKQFEKLGLPVREGIENNTKESEGGKNNIYRTTSTPKDEEKLLKRGQKDYKSKQVCCNILSPRNVKT